MTGTPRISVLMPVYNARRYVAEAVASILGQTYDDIEVIIIDDGSTDESQTILQSFAARDARVRLRRRPNTGYVVALIEMLAMARGPLIARMDADDVSMPDRFERQVAYLDAHPECVALGTRAIIIDPDGEALRLSDVPTDHEAIDAALIGRQGQMMFHPSMMMRREAIDQVGGYRVDYTNVEDLDLFLKLAEVGRLANLPEPLIRYREHMQKVGMRHLEDQERKITQVIREAHQRRGTTPDPNRIVAERRRVSEADTRRKWAWWALRYGNMKAARKHARRAMRREPFSIASWKLMYCALRGR